MPIRTRPEASPNPPTVAAVDPERRADRPRWSAGTWAWVIGKNVIGWLLILTSPVIGAALPGPGGTPLFIIGFALITFPGKRHLTARFLRGKPVDPRSRAYRLTVIGTSLLLAAGILFFLGVRSRKYFEHVDLKVLVIGSSFALLTGLFLVLGFRFHGAINWAYQVVARGRRKVRPWMRSRGLDLLPPRRRRRGRLAGGEHQVPDDDDILEIHERHQTAARNLWATLKPWLRRGLGVVITAGIFFWMFRPVHRGWDTVKHDLGRINWGWFALASVMFACFLFCFRAMSWRYILSGFGNRLPVAPATRIWSTSELARYLPGAIWQVVGRVYLVKPYGVSGTVCSTSQILELTVFLLANVLVALACMLWLGIKNNPSGHIRVLLYSAMGFVPVLLLLLHPRIFYGLMNRLLRRLKKPAMTEQLKKRQLLGLGVFAIAGLLWQGLTLWAVVHEPLHLQFTKWWVVAGAYGLAWCAGFLAFWAPGGLGVREMIFVLALGVAVPPQVRGQFTDPEHFQAFCVFLGILLRLWTIAGELILASIAYVLDYRGALNDPQAPGRVARGRGAESA